MLEASTCHTGTGLSFPGGGDRHARVTPGQGRGHHSPSPSPRQRCFGRPSVSWSREHPCKWCSPAHLPLLVSQAEAEPSTGSQPHTLTWQPQLPLIQAEIEGKRGSSRGHCCCPTTSLPRMSHMQPELPAEALQPCIALCRDRVLLGKSKPAN